MNNLIGRFNATHPNIGQVCIDWPHFEYLKYIDFKSYQSLLWSILNDTLELYKNCIDERLLKTMLILSHVSNDASLIETQAKLRYLEGYVIALYLSLQENSNFQEQICCWYSTFNGNNMKPCKLIADINSSIEQFKLLKNNKLSEETQNDLVLVKFIHNWIEMQNDEENKLVQLAKAYLYLQVST